MRQSKRIRGLRSSLETVAELKEKNSISTESQDVDEPSSNSQEVPEEKLPMVNNNSSTESSVESSDDEPEEISHSESKSKAAETEQQQKESILLAEQSRKRKNKEREERNKTRKEEKRQRMMVKLPSNLLDQVNEEDLKRKETKAAVTASSGATAGTPESDTFSTESGFASTESLPVHAPRIRPVTLNRFCVKPKPITDSARKFLHRQLYGRRIERRTNLLMHSKHGKSKYVNNGFDS